MKLKPLFDRVVVEPEEVKTETSSGLVLPTTSQERPFTGIVRAIGSGVDLDNNNVGMQVNIGDKVLYNKYSGAEFKIDNKTYLIIRQIDLIAIVNE